VLVLSQVMEGDPQLMAQKSVIRAVSHRLSDDQISVREAALSLVGSYVAKSPDVASSFQSALLLRLADVGVSVRKRCVKIWHDLLAAEPRFPGRSSAFCALLARVSDPREEEGVRDSIHHLFLKLWLDDGDSHLNDAASDAANPAQLRGRKESKLRGSTGSETTRSSVAAEQMVEVARSRDSAEHLETLLRDLLRGATENDKGRKQTERNKRAELARSHCDRLVSSLFDLLLSIEESRSSSPGQHHGKDIAAALQTIAAFADLAPAAVFPRVETVLPYLKADNAVGPSDELAIVTATCEILYRLAATRGPEMTAKAARVSGDLRDVTYKYASSAVEAAIRTLSLLATHASGRGDFDADLFKLSHRFYKYLYKKKYDDAASTVRSCQTSRFCCHVRSSSHVPRASPPLPVSGKGAKERSPRTDCSGLRV
jgi:cohesin loading factor subunit SCC2